MRQNTLNCRTYRIRHPEIMIKQRHYKALWASNIINREHIRRYHKWYYLKNKMHKMLTPIILRKLNFIA
jgi:hypothetical protein